VEWIVAPLTVPEHVPCAPVALVPSYDTLFPSTVPVYEALPPPQTKLVAQPLWVIVHRSSPHEPVIVHVPAMLEHVPPPAVEQAVHKMSEAVNRSFDIVLPFVKRGSERPFPRSRIP
jgi:hypothetical protein